MNSVATSHEEAIIIDGLFCKLNSPIPPTSDIGDMMFDHILASGVTAFNDSAIADSYPQTISGAAMKLYEEHLIVESVPDKALIVRTVEDIYEAKRTGRVGVILSTQGLACMGGDTRNLWLLHRLDVRIMQLTYNERNSLGCGCREPNDTGLSRVGQKAIEEINRLGVVVDLSHGGERTCLEAARYSTAPVIVSHAGVRALNPHPRNLTDELVSAVAETGGVIGLCPHSVFVEKERGKRPSINDFIDQIEYVADKTGVDHAGIGTDNFHYETHFTRVGRMSFERTFPGFFGGYGNEEKHAEGFSQWSDWPNLTSCLQRRGFSQADTIKVLGGNFLRVFKQVWG
jgi:membrane dipeptidase